MTEPAPAVEGQAIAPAPAPEAQGQAPSAEATPAPASEQGSWFDSAPDEVKGYIQNKGWDDPIKAVTSYQELEKFRGASEDQLLKLPKDFSEDGALDAIYDKLGRPESADKYAVEYPDGMQVDKDRLGFYQEVAHKAGLSQTQFEAIAKADSEYYAQAMEAHKAEVSRQQEAEYQELRKEWGGNAEEREELSRRGLRAMLPEGSDKAEIASKIEEALGTAMTLKLFANVGDKLGREASIHESSGDRPFGYTREQAAADKASLMSELKAEPQRLRAYNEGNGKDYEKMAKINKILAG